MNQDERIHVASGDQPGGNDGLAERRGRGQHAGLMEQEGVGGLLLVRSKRAVKCHVE